MPRPKHYLLIIFSTWLFLLVISLVLLEQTMTQNGRPFDWTEQIVRGAIFYSCPFLWVPIIYITQYRFSKRPLWQFVIVTCCFYILYLFSQALMDYIGNSLVHGERIREYPDFLSFALSFHPFFVFTNSVLYFLIYFATYAALHSQLSHQHKISSLNLEKENTQLELNFSNAKLHALQNQLTPHFLFNALNSIASLINNNSKNKALTATSQLSDLMRFALNASSKKIVSIHEEVNFLNDYIAMQKLRYGSKLSVSIHKNDISPSAECPPFILQTLVENAIVHTIEQSGCATKVFLNLTQTDKALIISSNNTLSKQEPVLVNSKNTGIGLSNLRSRLQLIYGYDDVKITKDQKQFDITIFLPQSQLA